MLEIYLLNVVREPSILKHLTYIFQRKISFIECSDDMYRVFIFIEIILYYEAYLQKNSCIATL